MEEIWKDIQGFEGFYQASNLGRIKSLERIVPHTRGNCPTVTVQEKILSIYVAKNGYSRVCLHKGGRGNGKVYRVHRLVANAFIPNPENKPDINHKNAIKHDNRLENIEWSTEKENINHAFANGLHKSRANFANSNCKVTKQQVIEIKKLLELGYTGVEIHDKLQVSVDTISRIKTGKSFVNI